MARSPSRRFLVDGFPRNMDNLSVWNEVEQMDVSLHAPCLHRYNTHAPGGNEHDRRWRV